VFLRNLALCCCTVVLTVVFDRSVCSLAKQIRSEANSPEELPSPDSRVAYVFVEQ
jgi:hypothetical protein